MPSHRLRLAVGLLVSSLLAALSTTSPVRANGRFPAAFQLVQNPEDPAHLVAQLTYGLVSTRDGGGTWFWTCEQAMGFVGAFDPPIAVTGEGVVFAALFDGLGRSSPDGCDWSFVEGPAEGRYPVDVSVSRADPRVVVVLTTDGIGEGRYEAHLMRSSDGGATFADVGDAFPDDFIGVTLDVAPSDPTRIYVTGFFARGDNVYDGVFGRSFDGGETFELLLVEGTDASRGPFLGAVHPTDPDVAFVRLAGPLGRLLRTPDAGASWETLFEAEGALEGFALSPDGETIVLGGATDPVHRGPSEGGVFEQLGELRPRCLSWFDEGVYACASEAIDGFTIGLSLDEGATFTSLFSRFCTSGPIACPEASSIGEECPAEWEVLRETIGADACFGSGGGGADGSGGQSSSTSSTSAAPATTSAEGSGGGASEADPPSSGCCAIAGGGGSGRAAAAALAVGVAALAMRRPFRRQIRVPTCKVPPPGTTSTSP